MGLGDIPIRVVDSTRTDQVRAVLAEVATLLESLLAHDVGGAIDVRGLPLSPADFQALEEVLGQGEVYAEIEVKGVSRVFETGYAGVWRVTHFDDDEQVIADNIEVAWAPLILRAHRDDVAHGLQELRAIIAPDS